MLDRLRRILQAVIGAAQKVVLTVALFFVYYIGIGLTRLLALVTRSHAIAHLPADAPSFWEDAARYDVDPVASTRQT